MHQVFYFSTLCLGTCFSPSLEFSPLPHLLLFILKTQHLPHHTFMRPPYWPKCFPSLVPQHLHKPLANYFSNIAFFSLYIYLPYLTISASKAGTFSNEFWLSQGLVLCSGYHRTQWREMDISGYKIILHNLFSFPQIIIGKSWFKSHPQAKTYN